MNVPNLQAGLAADLRLENRAREDAINGLPKSTAMTLMAAERDAVAAAENAAKEELGKVDGARKEATSALTKARETLSAVTAHREGIEDEAPPAARNLDRLVETRDRATANYEDFKALHRLTREATGDDRIEQAVWVAVVALVESVVNAYFYMPISSLGLLGAIATAFFVSLANVSLAFVGGASGLRYLAHTEPAKKLGGVVATLITLCGCALVVALSALFRGHVDALAGGDLESADLADAAWAAAVASLQGFEIMALFGSLNSFLLVFVGAACAVFCFWKGLQFDDPYPGFGQALRNKENAEEAYEDSRAEDEEYRQGWWQAHRGRLREQKGELDRAESHLDAALAGFQKTLLDAAGLAGQTAQLAAGLLGVYRTKNEALRQTATPTYFGDGPTSFPEIESNLQELNDQLPTLRREAERFIESCKHEQQALAAAIAKDGS